MKNISCSGLKMSGSSSTLLLVLMLLLSRVAGDINRSGSYSDQSSAAMTDSGTSDELQSSLRFEPSTLDFGDACPVGSARAHTVTLVNQNANRSVYLTSVSGRTPTFYSSFFEAKVVPPQGNTTFNVVFLPRAHGSVATDLLIHTSFGQARLQVRGEGRDCPYRLKPLVGIKAPLNATITPEIQMYNPHNRPLQILEVYSSGGQFQLELPSGGQEGPQTLWEIPPYETKPVIRIRFHARSAGNYTAYIRIKISEQVSEGDTLDHNGNVLVIPVEFEILPLPGLYADNPVINFGRLTAEPAVRVNSIKTLQIKLQLHSSYIRQQYQLLDYKLRNMPGLSFDPKDGVVILESTLFESTTILDEILLLRSVPITAMPENATMQPITPIECTVLIRAEVFKGSLQYDSNSTTFVTQATIGTRGGNKRTLVIRNDFDTPLALLNVSLPQYIAENGALRAQFSSEFLDAMPAGSTLVLPHSSSITLLQLQMLNSSLVYKTNLLIRTNITHIEVPLVVCGGRLHVSTYDTARIQANAAYNVDLNLGAIPLAETSHNGYIVLHNRNPLPVKLNTWHFQSPQGVYFHTTFRGCLRPSSLRALRNATLKLESAKFKLCTQLEEDDVAVFQITIQSYITEQHQCTLKIWTTYEEITTTVRFRTWIGKLEVDQEHLYFNNCFPGKHCSAELTIRSTFQHPIHISSINFTEAGLYFEDYKSNGSTIEGNALTKVGRIHFEPSLLCQQRCYIPQDERTNMIAFPAPENTRGGLNNNLHFDETELRRRTELFRHLKYDFQNIAFTLNSNELRQFLLELIIDIEWPKFVSGKQVLPTIEVSKMQEVQVLLSNPADTPVLVDYFLSDPRYAKETQLSLPLEVVDISPNCYLTDKEVFSLPAGAPRHPVLLPPHTSLPVRIRFEAPLVDTYCTLLHIRNNLTLYEAVWVSAKVVQSQFRIGNRKPGPNATLPFEFNEKHFAVCSQGQTQSQYQTNIDGETVTDLRKYPKVVLRRTFTARNTGEMPILINTFQIGDQFCSGYGFSIINCSSFVLKVNETKKLEFVFTPDYTLSRIVLPLRVHTNLSYDVNYNLVAQLPPGTIERCGALILRPAWEERIRNSAIVLLATTFIFVLLAAHIDYRNILRSQTVLYEARDKGSVYPTFNLRNIALKSLSHTPDEEQQQTSGSAGNAHAQSQRRGGSQQQQGKASNSSSSSSSSIASVNNFNGATSNTAGLKKRGLKRQTNANGNVAASRVSLPWSLDLNAFKSGVSAANTSGDNERAGSGSSSTSAQQMVGSAGGGKKGAGTLSSTKLQQTHNERGDKGGADTISTVTTTNGSASSGAVNSKKTQNSLVAHPLGGTSPQQQQQPRSARRSRNVATSAAPASEKETASTNAGNLKSQVNGSSNGKSARSNKSNNSEAVINLFGNTKGNVYSDMGATITPSPPAKEVIAQTNTTSGKHGKTPGRERRKDKDAQSSSLSNNGNDAPLSNCSSSSANSGGGSSSASRRAERRSRQRAAAALRALNFGDASANSAVARTKAANAIDNNSNGASGASGINGLLSCLTTAWDTGSPATFSDVLQAQPVNLMGTKSVQNLKEHSNVGTVESRSVFHFSADKDKGTGGYEKDYNGIQPEQNKPESQIIGQKLSDVLHEKVSSSTELGPIGSKKSPSSTPVWEPINSSSSSSGSSNHSASGLQIPKAVIPTGNCSFFSNLLGNYEYDGNRPLRAMDSNLYDMKKAQDEYFEYMYNLRQQQLQAQVQAHAQAHVQAQQQQQQQHLLQGVDWARLNSRTWSPLATYLGQHDSPILSGGNGGGPLSAAVNSASASAALQMSNLNTGSHDVSAWPIGGGGGSTNSSSPAGNVAPNNSVNVNSTIIRPPPGLESNFQGITNNTQATAQQQQQHQQQQSLNDATQVTNDTANMQTFDPFSSLSSIWSDSWQKRNNSNNSNKSNGNMN